MKKLLLVTILLCTCYVSHAQDTVSESTQWYMFKPHADIVKAGWTNQPYPIGHNIVQYSGKDARTITVYGVALTMNYIPVEEDRANSTPTMTPTVMLLNHEAYGNPPTVSLIDSTNVLGTMRQCFFNYELANGNTFISPSYEYYFDTPHPFNSSEDTFYVSFYIPNERHINYLNWWDYVMSQDSDYLMWIIRTVTNQSYSLPPDGWYSNCTDGIFDFLPMYNYSSNAWGFIFPIVNLRCTAPYPSFAGHESNSATITWWQAEAGESYQLALATYGGNPDTGLLVTPTDTFYTFTGLQPDTIYQVWARKACRYTTAGYDTLVWSDWGRPLTFRAAVGIGEVDDMTLQVAVRDGGIAVQGLAVGERAEVFDMQGRRVASLPSDGVTPPLPQGVYLLRTTAHSRARKVVVLR